MRALVIEDHPRMSALLRQGLEEEGYAVDATTTLLDGMSLANEHEFDAIRGRRTTTAWLCATRSSRIASRSA